MEPVAGADGTLYLVRAGEDDLVVRDAGDADRALVRRLADEPCSPGELAASLSLPEAVVREKLGALDAAGVLVRCATSAPLEPADAERYAAQLPYLAELGDERDLQRRLGASLVAVIGCGGLGTWVIAGLAAAGVRRFRLVDDDAVEPSNLNRQILYGAGDVGALKVEASAAWLRELDPRVAVETRVSRVDGEAAASAVAGADAVVLAADSPPYALARWVNAACVAHGVPFVCAGQLPPLVKIGPVYWPGRTACFACHETELRRSSADYDGYVRHVQTAPPRGATLGPAAGIAGSAVAMELVHLLLGVTPASAGAALLLDLRTMALRRVAITRDSACPACRHAQGCPSGSP